jgi:hypothetical protein
MYIRLLVLAVVAIATAFAQVGAVDSPYQVRYASNLNIGDSVINITNSGARGADLQAGTAASITGSICANVYAFSPDEQMISCCSCPVTPNGLRSLSAQRDLISNTLTPAVPTSITIKLLATVPVGGSCNNSAAAVLTNTLAPGMLAWGTTIHAAPVTPVVYSVTETPFSAATLSAGELFRLGTLCNFILANGSGFGVCRSCQLGGLGAVKK